MFQETPRHTKIFDWIQNGDGHAAIVALAGSGKTSTMVEATGRIMSKNPRAAVLAVAFNASIKNELAARMPEGVTTKTLNGFGWGSLLRESRGVKLDAKRNWELINHFLGQENSRIYGPAVAQLVGLAKSAGLVPDTEAMQKIGAIGILGDTPEAWENLIQRFEVLIPEIGMEAIAVTQDRVIEYAKEILGEGLTRHKTADFDDQLYKPIALGLALPKFDWVIVDESQDLSPLQHELISRALADGGRLLAVGDPNQAIYGFRGADSKSMDRLIERFGMDVFTLPVSYRCPKSVAALARETVPAFEALESAPDGEIKNLSLEGMEWNSTDLVMCRNTAPLIKLAYRLIRDGIGCQVLGKDIGAGLGALVKKANGKQNQDLQMFVDRLVRHVDRQVARLVEQKKEIQAEAIQDKRETIFVILEDTAIETVRDLTGKIFSMFSAENGKKKNVVTLCTVHKCKGLEAPRAIILNSFLMPSRFAKQDWQIEQESNLIYVAQTRAKETLAYVDLPMGDK